MAYVALSRVHSINGVYLTKFDPVSIMVSSRCLEEVNRLRGKYKTDLPVGTYELPAEKKLVNKCKITANIDNNVPPSKRTKTRGSKRNLDVVKAPSAKRVNLDDPVSKKPLIMQDNHPSCSDKDCFLVSEQNVTHASTTSWPQFCYYQVNEQWQRSVCARMPELQFISRFVCVPGGHNVILTRPNHRRLRSIAIVSSALFHTSLLALKNNTIKYEL